MSNNILFEKKYINELQNSLNANKAQVYNFDFTFNKISLGCVTIAKQFNDYTMLLSEDINKEFFNNWNSSICKYFLRDVRQKKNNLYKIAYNNGVYFLLREVDNEKDDKFNDVKYIDSYYSVVTISDNKDFITTYTPAFKLWSKFVSITNEYDYTTDIENSDELTSKTLFDEGELSN